MASCIGWWRLLTAWPTGVCVEGRAEYSVRDDVEAHYENHRTHFTFKVSGSAPSFSSCVCFFSPFVFGNRTVVDLRYHCQNIFFFSKNFFLFPVSFLLRSLHLRLSWVFFFLFWPKQLTVYSRARSLDRQILWNRNFIRRVFKWLKERMALTFDDDGIVRLINAGGDRAAAK